jgi:ubiquinone/menaquinone biosynthesis C-methylase UbiE
MRQTSKLDLEKWRRVSREHFSRITSHYDEGRKFEGEQHWLEEIKRRVLLEDGDWALDAGSGTGLLSVKFGEQIRGRVLGLEPSTAMLSQARQRQKPGNVFWAQGVSEALPFAGESLKAVFLSQVWHHLQSPEEAAREFFRCLQNGGGLFIKTYSHDQIRARWDLQVVFPELMPFMLGVYPDKRDFELMLKQVGFRSVTFLSSQRENFIRPSQLLVFLREKVWSMFSFLSPQEAAAGEARLKALAADGDAPAPYPEFELLVIALK